MIKVRIEVVKTGEVLEFEGDKVRVAWHNATCRESDDDPEWHYMEQPEESE